MKGHGMSEARSVLGVICSFYDSFLRRKRRLRIISWSTGPGSRYDVGELARASGTSDATVSRILSQMRV